ncbi:GNAT family N-acetyltransferase [Motilimonas sp. E26]|uniref:GNAT family N-acetyltransferase n=1 Tax=Motilimonas sp. E26 TaxID=2865674 RepID=UPI001E5A0D20|nr:GNAT family N-acetyltransferase [Motilimonas sp. E26]MCE0557269.1 GNAT family N-acetyltransferase [Motilimonas sp. E26]
MATIWYLESLHPDELKSKPAPADLPLNLVEVEVAEYQYNRFLYQLVGAAWQWTDKLNWSDSDWRKHVESGQLRTWVLYYSGAPAGYFELHKEEEDVEIRYFGLSPRFIGKGIGGYLLSEAIAQAWAWQAQRVWVHTCDSDHPGALKNYQARGLALYKTDIEP